ncbi:MAG: TonB-dependent receptor [Bacteroidales bacterium]
MKRIWFLFSIIYSCIVFAQHDSIALRNLDEVSIVEDRGNSHIQKIISPNIIVNDSFIINRYDGNLFKTLNKIPGISSMDIGSGFSKPNIRGMGFDRIVLVENGIKHYGQEWGVDHGLEIDAFKIKNINIVKGAYSLLYGSGAIGGVIIVEESPPSQENNIFGEFISLFSSANTKFGESLQLGFQKDNFLVKIRYTQQNYSDYKIPTDSIIYLTRSIPIYNNRLKNTAGYEKDIDLYFRYSTKNWISIMQISNAKQKNGLFPGAHGIPSINRVLDDGNYWGIDLPYNSVNHFKLLFSNTYLFEKQYIEWNLGFQNNLREEFSPFNTHYIGIQPPEINPNKELGFDLNTISNTLKMNYFNGIWKHVYGIDMNFKLNKTNGYSFLLPEYKEFSTGVFFITNIDISDRININYGVRYDYCAISIDSYFDNYLKEYLILMAYKDSIVDYYSYRTKDVNKNYYNSSYSIGLDYKINNKNRLKINIGKSFRVPNANELASNGVHHASFRHERGNNNLEPEKGWQINLDYIYKNKSLEINISPFYYYFSNFIFLQPTGLWSLLPDAGQVYEYRGSQAILIGTELSLNYLFSNNFRLTLASDYIFTHNLSDKLPLNFSPQSKILLNLSKNIKRIHLYIETEKIFSQYMVARNEESTKGALLFNCGYSHYLKIKKQDIHITLSINNILNKRYMNHMSFYRKIEIPEQGRNIQAIIKIPFNINN